MRTLLFAAAVKRGFAGFFGLVILCLAAPVATAQTIEFLPGAPSVYENGLGGGTNVTIIVTRSPAIGISTVDFSTADGSATSPADYTGAAFQLSFTNGESFKVISILVVDDLLQEGTETFFVRLDNVVGGTLGASSNVTVTIFDNDNFFRFIPTTNQLVLEDQTNAVILVERVGDLNGSASVDFFTRDGTAVSAPPALADFTSQSGSLIFTNGQGTNELLIPITEDCRIEPTEFFQVVLTNGIGGTVDPLADVMTVGIANNDTAAGTVEFGALSVDVLPLVLGDPVNPLIYEHLTRVITVRVVRRQACDVNNVPVAFGGAATVDVNDLNNGLFDCPGTDLARRGIDYTIPGMNGNGVLTLNLPNANPVTFTILVTEDLFVELDEAIRLQLSIPNQTPLPALGDRRSQNIIIRSDELPAGGVVPYYNPLSILNPTPGANNAVYAVAVVPFTVPQSGGMSYLGGDFTGVDGVVRNRIARVNSFGLVDTGFDPGSGADGFVETIAVQTDGRVLIGGGFTSVNNVSRAGVARLNEDGSLDAGFLPGNGVQGIVHSIVLQPDGMILLGGEFDAYNDQPVRNVARLFPNGLLDISFDPGVGPDGAVWSLALSPFGPEVYAGGDFTTFANQTRNHIVRLTGTGGVDAGFVPLFGADDAIYSITVTANGQPMVAGAFTQFDGQARAGVARLTANGLLDPTFDPGTGVEGTVYSLQLQANGQPIIAGDFLSVNGTPRKSIARLNLDGTVDTSFLDVHYNQTQPGVDGFINAVGLDFTGNLMVGGTFATVGGGLDTFGGMVTNAVTPKFNYAQLMGGANPEAFNMPGNVQFVSAQYSIDENVLGGFLTITMVRTNGRYGPLTVNCRTEDGTAVADVDYVGQSNTVTWADCEFGILTFTIRILDNALIEGNRTFKLVVSDPISVGGVAPAYPSLAARSKATVTIIDNDFPRGVLGFSQPVFTAGEADGNALVTVTRTNGSVGQVTVEYATFNQTATSGVGNDYTLKAGTLTFASGVTNQTISVTINNDTASENEEWFGLRLTNVTGGASLSLSNTTVLILDNEPSSHGSVGFASGGFSVNESNATATIVLRRTSGALGAINVSLASFDFPPANGNARSNVDYVELTTNVTFATGVLTQLVTVPIFNDHFVEGNEQLGLTITSVSGGTLGFRSNAVLTVVDDDSYGVLSLTEVNYFVNELGSSVLVNVVRTAGDAEEVSVDFATTALTATDGADYRGTNGTLIFPDGVLSASFTIAILNDPDLEYNETLAITLTNFQKAGQGAFTNALLTIIDDEALDVDAGSVDTGFESHPNGFVNALGLQSDGRLIIGGDFTTVSGFPFNRLARLTVAGTLDPLFHPGSGANDKVHALVVQPDNKIIIGGRFTQFDTTNRGRVARLKADGTLDASFNPGAGADNPVFALALTPQGKVVLGGSFTTVNGVTRPNVALLGTNGTPDVGFNTGAGVNGTVYAVAVQPDGKILIGGDFTTVNNTNRARIARLHPNGSLDLSFNAGSGPDAAVRALAVQADGFIVVGGSFTNLSGASARRIARLTPLGAMDSGFTPGQGTDGPVLALTVLPNNQIIAVGDFHLFNGVSRNRITRLNANGTVDPTINFGTGANSFISAVLVQPNEEIVVGGGFTEFNGTPRDYVARLVGGQNPGAGEFAFLSSVFSVDENGTNVVITVRRLGGTTGSAQVHFATSDGVDFPPYVGAVAPGDYAETNSDLIFPQGETLQTFLVRVNNDSEVEGDKLLFLSLSAATAGAGINAAGADAAMIIREDDSSVGFITASFSVNEGAVAGHASITLLRTGSTNSAVSVLFTTLPGTATAGPDYTPTAGLVLFGPGETAKVTTVPVSEDAIVEGSETVDLLLISPVVVNRPDSTAVLGLSTATLTIVDNDFLPGEFTLVVASNFVNEGAGLVTITVLRTNGSSGIVSVDYSLVDGTAVAGQDYVNTSATLSYADGETVKTFQVPILNDAFLEGDEFLNLVLSNPQGDATLGAMTSSILNILDDDYIGFSTNIFSVNESDGVATITVLRAGNTNLAFYVDFTTSNGTAQATFDYAVTNGRLSFAAGELSRTFDVRVFDDALVEPVETVILLLTNASPNVDLSGVVSAQLNLIDSTKVVSFSTNAFSIGEGETNATIQVVRAGNLADGLTVTLSTHDLTAGHGYDYTGFTNLITFTNGEVVKTVLVPIYDDTQPEFTETLVLSLAPPGSGYVTSPSNAALSIVDNDFGPGFPDTSFDPGAGASRFVRALALQPDGRLLVGGAFTNFGNVNLNYLARLLTNGVVDTNFTPGTGPNALVSSFGLSSGGHIAVGGSFSTYNGSNFNRVVRLTSNGLPDALFTQPTTFDAAVHALVSQVDGKIVAGGAFALPLSRVARVRVNGTLDLQYDPGTGADGTVHALALQPDGQVVLGGTFTNVAGFTYPRLARLGSNGVVDSTLLPLTITNGNIFALALTPGGKILIGGNFRYVNGVARGGIARLHADGSLDTGFAPFIGVTGTVYTVSALADGSVFIGGDFTSVNGLPRNRYALLQAGGAVETTFDASLGADNTVYASLVTSDQKIVIGGDFTTVGGLTRRGVARLNVGDATAFSVSGPYLSFKAARIRLNAVPGRAYILEGSLDLSTWSGLSTNVAAGVFLDLTDPNADINSRRYYRARRFGP